jgi:hypothetical protein
MLERNHQRTNFLPIAIALWCCHLSTAVQAQDQQAQKAMEAVSALSDSIVAEGKALYRSEMASWYGFAVFGQKMPELMPRVGGYLTNFEGTKTRFVVFNDAAQPQVVFSILYDTAYNNQTASIDAKARAFTEGEQQIYAIRQLALGIAAKDTLFKRYKNCSLDPVPIVSNGTKRVYFFTNTQQPGIILFGNDYLIEFDKDNQPTAVKKFHDQLTPVSTKPSTTDTGDAETTFHLHDREELMTATDVCTLLLNKKVTNWNQHLARGKEVTSIWDSKNTGILFVPNDTFDNFGKESAEEKH